MLSTELNVQECDATDDDSNIIAGSIKIKKIITDVRSDSRLTIHDKTNRHDKKIY
jgi:hypothetical protein